MSETSAGVSEDRPPVTYGDVRRRLEAMGNPWTVDPLISDEEPLPQFPTGGPPRDAPDFAPVARPISTDDDIRELIAELPPNDPELRQRWDEAGIPLDREVAIGTSDRLIEEHAAAPPEGPVGKDDQS